jgi:hypothetical protein
MNDKLPTGGLPPAHLDQVFTPPTPRRSGGLKRILSPVPPADPEPATDDPASESESVVPEQPSPPDAPPAQEQPVAKTKPAKKASTDKKQLVIIYMPADQRDWLRRAAAGSTQLNVVLTAVEQAELSGELGQAVADAQEPAPGGLFERPHTGRGTRAHVQVSLSTLPSNIEVLDQLVAKHGATDRSALVRAALTYARQHGRKRT